MIGTVISVVGGLVGKWMTNRAEVAAAKHKRRLTQIEQNGTWDEKVADAMSKTWKDEFVTVIVFIPIIMLFIGGESQQLAIQGFQALKAHLPEYYWLVIGAVLASSLGLKDLVNKFVGRK